MQILRLSVSNPELKAEKDYQNGKVGFIMVHGDGYILPGIDFDENESLVHKKLYSGPDTIYRLMTSRLKEIMVQYAEVYNIKMKSLIEKE